MSTPNTLMDISNAIILHTDRVEIALTRALLSGRTAAQIEAAIAQAAGVYPLPPLFVHINRDGSFAVAAGSEPDIWPEDMPKQPERPP